MNWFNTFLRSTSKTTKPQLPDKPHHPKHSDLQLGPWTQGDPPAHKLHPPHSDLVGSSSCKWCHLPNVASRVHIVFLTTSQPSHSRDSNENHTYEVQPGLRHYTIPRSGFVLFSQMQIYVKAVNQLGEVMSPPIVLEPVSAGEKERRCVLFHCW